MTEEGRRLWWLIDGLPHWLLQGAVRKAPERLPNFAAIHADQRLARLVPLAPNCQTPASLAALYCAADSDDTGLCGFDLPDFAAGDLAITRAFSRGVPDGLARVWDHERQGRGLRLLHVPYVHSSQRADVVLNGFGPAEIAPAVLSEAEARARHGIAPDAPGWAVFRSPSGHRGLARKVHIRDMPQVLVLGVWPVHTGAPENNVPPFLASGLQHFYRRGALGDTLRHGGDGTAEALFIDSLRQMAAHYNVLWLTHLRRGQNDDIYGYQPALDLALHELAGYLAPECDHWTPARAELVWPLLIALLEDFDSVLEQSRKLIRPQDRFIVSSDHGMMPVDLLVRPNLALLELGLLALDSDGEIDTARSRAWLHPAENGLLCIRADDGDPGLWLQRLVDLLDARTGRQAAVTVHPGVEAHLVPSPGLMARHFLWAGARCQIRAATRGALVEATEKTGEHVVAGPDPRLEGVVMEVGARHTPALPESLHPWQVSARLHPLGASTEASRRATSAS